MFNNDIFLLIEGNVTDSRFNYTKASFKNVTLAGVKFYNCVLCIDPSVKLVDPVFVNSTFEDPENCRFNSKLRTQEKLLRVLKEGTSIFED